MGRWRGSDVRRLLTVLLMVLFVGSGVQAQDTESTTRITRVAWSPVGDQIAYADASGNLQIVSSQNGGQIFSFQRESSSSVSVLEWSPDGNALAVATENGPIEVWDTETGTLRNILQVTGTGIRSLSWNPDSTQLASASQEAFPDNVTIWDVSTGTIVFSPIVGDALSVALSPDGALIAVSKFGEIQLWDAVSRQLTRMIHTPEYIVAMAWNPNNMTIASADTYVAQNSVVRIWDINTGQLLDTLEGHTDVINAVHWNASGDQLVTASHDGTVRLWDAFSGQIMQIYQTGDSVFTASFSPFGGQLTYGGTMDNVTSPDGSDVIQNVTSIANGAIQIIVPDPSIERLNAIAAACGAPVAPEASLSADVQPTDMADFIAQVEALPADSIPPACAADLLAVARALEGE